MHPKNCIILFKEECRLYDIEELLKKIIDDATGDLKNPQKRIWAIRSDYYRKAKELLDETR